MMYNEFLELSGKSESYISSGIVFFLFSFYLTVTITFMSFNL